MTKSNISKCFFVLFIVLCGGGSVLAQEGRVHQWFDDAFVDFGKRIENVFGEDMQGIFADKNDMRPQITVTTKEDHTVIALDLKAVHLKKKDCSIEAEADRLTVAIETEDVRAHFSIKNYKDGALMAFDLVQKHEKVDTQTEEHAFVDRSFAATKTVQKVFDFEKTDASFKDGMLTLVVPYKEQKKVKIALK